MIASVRYLLVAVFGAGGAVCRYAVDNFLVGLSDSRFPWGTFAVNVVGAFAIGILVALTTERMIADPNWRIAIGAGFLGAFTTFSTYALDTVKLVEDNEIGLALVNAFGMLALGLLAAVAGLALGRNLT